MKVRGTSDFDVATSLSPEDVERAVTSVLDELRANQPDVLEAQVRIHEAGREIQVDVVWGGVSFTVAEDAMRQLAGSIRRALSHDEPSSSLVDRATELVPA